MGVFENRDTGIPQNGWLIMENPIKIDANKGYVPLFSETSNYDGIPSVMYMLEYNLVLHI